MEIARWNDRYRTGERAEEDLNAPPTPLVIEAATRLPPGAALDLACGTGRNALWLAEHGWSVTAVDGSDVAIRILNERAAERHLEIKTVVADLERGEFAIAESAWDLIVIAYYLQRDLFEPAKAGLRPGGVLVAIVHMTEHGEEPTAHRLEAGRLRACFEGWEVLHYYEGRPNDQAHQRPVAQIVARRRVRT
jgi:SAM-dependent methyltransferase